MRYFFLFLSSLSVGCAGLQKEYLAQNCNYESAYSLGHNSARDGQPMNSGVLNQCPDSVRASSLKGYREGYEAFAKSKPAQVNINILNNTSPGTKWSCKEAYGRKECGYDCKEAYGKIVCGKSAAENCVESFGNIRCGRNCREEHGAVKCDD